MVASLISLVWFDVRCPNICHPSCTLSSTVPSEPPRDIVGTAVDSTSLRVTWNPPSEENQNGVLIAYKISYTKISLGNAVPFDDQTAMIVEVDSAERTHDIENLEKWTVYELKMAAATIKGDGPWSTPISAQTDEDGKSALDILLISSRK